MGWSDLNWLEDVHMGYEEGKPAVFDRNINGLSRDFIYLPEQGRNVMVDVRAIRAALDVVYDADRIVAEIVAAGGTAVANADNVADWEDAQRMINTAVENFGDLHAVVNRPWRWPRAAREGGWDAI